MMRALHVIVFLSALPGAQVKDLFVELIPSTRGLTTAATAVKQEADVGGMAADFKAKSAGNAVDALDGCTTKLF